ncbi:hypothetical protein Cgig2_018148 [Carnegiea gigantea]|uniref:4-coumarate--CoA ligase n=1 Tax=Carnegiea gigantea TaxID=171969 RepID=A0A9Q1QRI9_9CARY|nr:hypothetical protein Cgig2_018148 [Carnegiea gigantea]
MQTRETYLDQLEEEEHIFRSRYRPVPVPDNVTLPEFVLQDAELYSDKVAIVEALTGKEYTYGQVTRDTKRFAKALRSLGLRKGHVVIVVLPNVAEYSIVALGIMAAGGVFSGVNPASHASEIKKQVEAADAKLIVTNGTIYEKVKELGLPIIVLGEERIENATAIYWEELLQAAAKANINNITEALDQKDLCALPFSSGTTGMSKGVMLTHRNLVANLCSTLFSVPKEMVGQVTTLGLMPFFHIYGITGICCATLRNKGKVVVMARYDLRTFLHALITYEVHFAPVVPPIILALVKNPIVDEFDLSKVKLKAIMTAAAPLAPEILTAFEKKFPGVQVQEAYGLTEHSCITLTHGDPSQEHGGIAKRNSVGFILPNIEVKFIDPETGRSLPNNTPGEIYVRSQCVMQGYYKNEEETRQTVDGEGWLHTGDIGYIDDDGDVFVVDRIKELIKMADEEAGEVPAGCVVKKAESRESEEDIIKFVGSNVAHYKRLRAVYFVDSIPKSPSGKIMRRLLKDKIMDLHKSNNGPKPAV